MAAPLISSNVDNNYCWRCSIALSPSPPPPMDRPSTIVPAGPVAASSAAPTPTGSSKGCGVPGFRKSSQKWCCGTEQCPMCHRFRKLFHCKTCVGNGDFGHSSAFDKGRSVQYCPWFQVHLSNAIPLADILFMYTYSIEIYLLNYVTIRNWLAKILTGQTVISDYLNLLSPALL